MDNSNDFARKPDIVLRKLGRVIREVTGPPDTEALPPQMKELLERMRKADKP